MRSLIFFIAFIVFGALALAQVSYPTAPGGSGYTPLFGTTAAIGGTTLTAGNCSTGTVTITGVASGRPALASPSGGNPGAGVVWDAQVTSANTVTVSVCAIAAGTPAALAYNVVVFP